MNVRIEKGLIIISLPMQNPRLSASGKTEVVATSRGPRQTTERVQGKFIHVVANAFILPDEGSGKQGAKKKHRGKN